MAKPSPKGKKPAGPALPSLGKVLFPTDLSPESLKALPFAASLARSYGGHVHVLHLVAEADTAIHQSHGYTTPEAVRAGVLAAAQVRMDEASADFAAPGVEFRTTADVVGSIPEAIAAHASGGACDVIVMATHARTGLAHFFGGSVTEATLRTTSLPILAIRVT